MGVTVCVVLQVGFTTVEADHISGVTQNAHAFESQSTYDSVRPCFCEVVTHIRWFCGTTGISGPGKVIVKKVAQGRESPVNKDGSTVSD